MIHAVLLGDSIFDNRSYTKGEPDVASHLRALIPDCAVTLVARDGTTTYDVGAQFERVPPSATHLFLSLGGNDALMNADLLNLEGRSTAEALDLFRDRVAAFELSYGHALEALLGLGRRTTVCTIYDGNLPSPERERAATALRLFNDVIYSTAWRTGASLLELRAICNGPSDYANPIEPSGSGGLKIAKAISLALDDKRPLGPLVTRERADSAEHGRDDSR
ncbi:MAG: SGNH/GDSL hydrolase family protein [Polyangiaceae bacterium]